MSVIILQSPRLTRTKTHIPCKTHFQSPHANHATLGNISPEYCATCAIFPIDEQTLSYLRLTGRPEHQIRMVEAYARTQGLWHDPDNEPEYSQTLELDLGTLEPSIAGPKRPQDRIPVRVAPEIGRASCRERVCQYV